MCHFSPLGEKKKKTLFVSFQHFFLLQVTFSELKFESVQNEWERIHRDAWHHFLLCVLCVYNKKGHNSNPGLNVLLALKTLLSTFSLFWCLPLVSVCLLVSLQQSPLNIFVCVSLCFYVSLSPLPWQFCFCPRHISNLRLLSEAQGKSAKLPKSEIHFVPKLVWTKYVWGSVYSYVHDLSLQTVERERICKCRKMQNTNSGDLYFLRWSIRYSIHIIYKYKYFASVFGR